MSGRAHVVGRDTYQAVSDSDPSSFTMVHEMIESLSGSLIYIVSDPLIAMSLAKRAKRTASERARACDQRSTIELKTCPQSKSRLVS